MDQTAWRTTHPFSVHLMTEAEIDELIDNARAELDDLPFVIAAVLPNSPCS
jgi:hypothetical protein